MTTTTTRQTTQANPSGVSAVKKYPIHAAAQLGPIDKTVVEHLKNEMSVRGYSSDQPIKLLWNEKLMEYEVIDGRHRQEAALALGLTPTYEFIDDISTTDYDTPFDMVLRTHHYREIKRQTKLIYVVESRPELNVGQQIKLAGGLPTPTIIHQTNVMRKALVERPDLWVKLKTGVRSKKAGGVTVASVAEMMGMSRYDAHHPQTVKNQLRDEVTRLTLLNRSLASDLNRANQRIESLEADKLALISEIATLRADLEEAERELGNL